MDTVIRPLCETRFPKMKQRAKLWWISMILWNTYSTTTIIGGGGRQGRESSLSTLFCYQWFLLEKSSLESKKRKAVNYVCLHQNDYANVLFLNTYALTLAISVLSDPSEFTRLSLQNSKLLAVCSYYLIKSTCPSPHPSVPVLTL